MAVTDYQRDICRLIARNRVASGESYVAGGVALNTLLDAARVSRDLDLFHDTREALAATWDADRRLLTEGGYGVDVRRERPTFVEAVVSKGTEGVIVEWLCDSAYRFFPLVEHPDFGLVLHPFDLATNKLLALVGRVEARDWVDIIGCSEHVQHIGYLAWAACGKDPGYSPATILADGKRTAHYRESELAALAFAGPAPDARELSARWVRLLAEADEIIERLPAHEVGSAVLDDQGRPFHGSAADIAPARERAALRFHRGRIRGALPALRLEV